MIPLLVILLFGASALAAYGLSPKTHAWVDEHVRAVREALATHDVAQAHLDQGQTEKARQAISESADKVAEAAKAAKDKQQRAVAAQMALLTTALGDQAHALTAVLAAQHQLGTAGLPQQVLEARQVLEAAQAQLADSVERIRRAKSALAALGVR